MYYVLVDTNDQASFRDPSSLEFKGWYDIVTIDDFWNWLEHICTDFMDDLVNVGTNIFLFLACLSKRITIMALRHFCQSRLVEWMLVRNCLYDRISNIQKYKILIHNKITGGFTMMQRRADTR